MPKPFKPPILKMTARNVSVAYGSKIAINDVSIDVDQDEVVGAVNLVAPSSARQKDIARELGRALHRPAVVPAPRFALRIVVGEFADSIIASQRLEPQTLTANGFGFEHADLTSAVRWLVR